jgi:phosphoribosylformylglycinamidine synthase
MLGVLDDVYTFRGPSARDGDAIVLLGETHPELGGSEALAVVHGMVAGRAPALDLGAEVALSKLLATPGLGSAAHDLSEGGLGVALAELCARSGFGAHVVLTEGIEPLWGLFGESTARALLTTDDTGQVLGAAERLGVPARVVGRMGGSRLEIDGVLAVSLEDLISTYEGAIPSLMDR